MIGNFFFEGDLISVALLYLEIVCIHKKFYYMVRNLRCFLRKVAKTISTSVQNLLTISGFYHLMNKNNVVVF